MALFEFDSGRLIPAQFGKAVGEQLGADVLNSVRDQVLELISRPLFPVIWHGDERLSARMAAVAAVNTSAEEASSSTPPKPHPVPVSEQATGDNEHIPTHAQPYSVNPPRLTALDGSGQVVSVEVMASLNAETLVGAMSRLGDASALGWVELASAYPGGLNAFRNAWAQFRESLPPRPGPGPRLVLVAGEITNDVRPALELLAETGVEIYEIQLREMSNGRRFLSVEELRPHVLAQQNNLLMGRSAGRLQLAEASRVAGNNPADGVAAAGSVAQRPGIWPAPRRVAAEVQPPGFPGIDFETAGPVTAPVATPPAVDDDITINQIIADITPVTQPAVSTDTGTFIRVQPEPSPGATPAPTGGPNAEDLAQISQAVGRDVSLVWVQKRRGVTHQAVLRFPGEIVLPTGGATKDPNFAADTVSGREGVDGWRMWRIDSELGPSLLEALVEIETEQARKPHN